jgi:ABC-type bacteriocin/lantibiotic exporter with double-glycine peptidase domain
MLNKLRYLFNGIKKKMYGLIFFLILNSLLEIFSLAIIYPITDLILFQNTPNYFNIDFNNFKKEVLIFLGVVFLFKALFQTLINYKQNKFIVFIYTTITNKIFNNYLDPLNIESTRNDSTGSLAKVVNQETYNFNLFVIALINVIVESILLLSIVCVLIFIKPLITLILLIFFAISSILFTLLTKRYLSNWGKTREVLDKDLNNLIIESLNGIDTIFMFDKSDFFTKVFSKKNIYKGDIYTKQLTLNLAPKQFLELATIIGVIIILLIVEDNKDLILTSAIMIGAAFKLIPSLNKIINSLQTIKFYKPSLNIIYDNYNKITIENQANKNIDFKDSIELKNITYSYSNEIVLNNFNLKIKKGEIIGFSGPSGSGKSTVVKLICGLLRIQKGDFLIDKINIKESDLLNFRVKIGYISQEPFLLNDSILNNIAFGIDKTKIDFKKVDNILKLTKFYDQVKLMPDGLNFKIGELGKNLSGGQRQRLSIARALYILPELIVLDEATTGVEQSIQKDVLQAILKIKNITVIIISHQNSPLSYCDRIIHF